MSEPLFDLGRIVATPGALEVMEPEEGLRFLSRHVRGDWGDVPPEDARENTLSVRGGFRILSSYETANGERVWVLTERDRSSTCLLLPSEY